MRLVPAELDEALFAIAGALDFEVTLAGAGSTPAYRRRGHDHPSATAASAWRA